MLCLLSKLSLLLLELFHEGLRLANGLFALRDFVTVGFLFLRVQRIPSRLSLRGCLIDLLHFGLRNMHSLQSLSIPGFCLAQPIFSRPRSFNHCRWVKEMLLIDLTLNLSLELAELHSVVVAGVVRGSLC